MLESRLPEIVAEIRVIVADALESGAEMIADDARGRVPVNTGNLRDAIHVDREREGVYVVAGDDETWYGHLVEHGTSHTAPRPFLVPALEGSRSEVVKRVQAGLGRL